MIINRIYENQNLLSLLLVSFLVWLRTYQHPCITLHIFKQRQICPFSLFLGLLLLRAGFETKVFHVGFLVNELEPRFVTLLAPSTDTITNLRRSYFL